MSKELQIRNSTVDFLVFTRDAGEDGIEVRVQNGDVWLTQKAISQLFDVDRSVVTKHLSNIFKEGELDENSTCANFAQVADWIELRDLRKESDEEYMKRLKNEGITVFVDRNSL